MDGEQRHRQGRAQGRCSELRPLASGPATHQQGQGQGIQDDGVEGIEDEAGEVVSPGLEVPEDVLDFQDYPGQGLVDADEEGGPGPADLGPAEATERKVLEEVLVVVPVD